MTEQQPETLPDGSPDPDEETPAPAPAETAPDVDKAERTGFAVYDATLKRYVGRIADSKTAANKAVTRVKGHTYEVRAV